MPWCPKCKTEYQNGISVCSDCATALVDELKEDLIPFFQSDNKKIADKLAAFFQYSDLSSEVFYDEESECYIVAIDPEKQIEAKKLYQAFYFVERERIYKGEEDSDDSSSEQEAESEDGADEDAQAETQRKTQTEAQNDAPTEAHTDDNAVAQTDESVSDEATSTVIIEEESEDYNAASYVEASEDDLNDYNEESIAEDEKAFADDDEDDGSTYIMKADRYKDLASTVWLFLMFGFAGIIFVLLNSVGILTVFSGWLPNLVMAALFIFFIYVAISTNNKAKKLKAEIAVEEELTVKINEWLVNNVTEAFLEEISDESISVELNYLRQNAAIKLMLFDVFGHQNEAYLDRLIEEYYNKTFDNADK